MKRKLYRSTSNRMIAGVCGGIGEAFGVDPTMIRLFWLLFILLPGSPGMLLYIVSSIILPEESDYYYDNFSYKGNSNNKVFIGLALILFGLYSLFRRVWPKVLYFFKEIFSLSPILLILLGFYIILKDRKNN